jgi:trk system potassium uptake protein TrkH
MHLYTVQRILGILLMVFSLTMLPPLLLSLWVDDGALIGFTDTFIFTLGLGLVIWLPVRRRKQDLRVRDGFLVVVLFWTVLGLSGSLPFLLEES